MTTKILVAGDANGQLDQLFARVAALHAGKGPFDCLICTGNFFGGDASAAEAALAPYKSAEKAPPLRTYFLGPPPPDSPPADADGKVAISRDLWCLASSAGIITLHGLRVGFACGRATELADDVAAMRVRASEASFLGVDLLLTHEWPCGFYRQLSEGGVLTDQYTRLRMTYVQGIYRALLC